MADRSKLPTRVHRKAEHVMADEGKSRREAYGMAAGMNRSGRLNEKGEYTKHRATKTQRWKPKPRYGGYQ